MPRTGPKGSSLVTPEPRPSGECGVVSRKLQVAGLIAVSGSVNQCEVLALHATVTEARAKIEVTFRTGLRHALPRPVQ